MGRAQMIDKGQMQEILSTAERYVRLLGVVPLDADWENLAKKWAGKLVEASGFKVTLLCESDNLLFSKSFTYDTDVANDRRSFQELKFIRERAVIDFPEFLRDEGVDSGLIEKNVEIEIVHLPVPISIVQVDDRVFANMWLHESKSSFEEVTQEHSWQRSLQMYVDIYFDPRLGRKYAADPDEEMLELFDHKRIPRGIYPRSSFYDTDYSQLVVWAFVFDRRGRLLIHRRADNAKDNQGMWDKSVGGHVDLSLDVETSRAVLRELVEELFSDEIKESQSDFMKWTVTDEDIVYLGEWRPEKRRRYPFSEINVLEREWVFFRLQDSQYLYSPRELPDGRVRRLRVISDVFLFLAGSNLTDESLGELRNSTFKLIKLADLKNAMDRAMRGEIVPGFDETKPVPEFTPDLTNIMTGGLRDTLEEFAQYIKQYITKR